MYSKLLRFLKNFLRWKYVGVLGLANATSILKMFVYAKAVSLSEFAMYATLSLVASFFVVVGSLGFITELQRRFPVDFRNGNTRDILTGVFQIVLIIASVLTLVALACVAGLRFLNISGAVLFAGAAGGAIQLLFSVVTNETRARLLLDKYSYEILIRNVLVVVCGLVVVCLTSDGFLIFLGESLSTLVVTMVFFRKFGPAIDAEGFRNLFLQSVKGLRNYTWSPVLAMMLIGILSFFMQFGERYVSKGYLSVEHFAILSFGMIIPNMATTFQAILNNSIFTNQVLRFSDAGRQGVVHYSFLISFKFFLLFAALSLPGYFLFKEIILRFYLSYYPILPFLPIVFLSFVFRSSDFISNIYIIVNKPYYFAIIQISYLAAMGSIILWADITMRPELTQPAYFFLINLLSAVIPPAIVLFVNWSKRESKHQSE